MAITFTWSVNDMHKVTETGAVYKVDWSCSGVDADTEVSHSRSGSYLHMGEVTADEVTGQDADGNDVTESVTRVVPVTPDHTASDFVAYDALDEATVLGWIQANGVQAYNEGLITSNITNKIAAQANSTGMPWAAE
tara:strand:+ start:594 stop:1001 length:408 start_codon:yes stop_codon:yes gene_type:complete